MPASTSTGPCYIPGTPGTPDTYIPGTPTIGNSPGTPGTVIPRHPRNAADPVSVPVIWLCGQSARQALSSDCSCGDSRLGCPAEHIEAPAEDDSNIFAQNSHDLMEFG